MKPEPKNLWTIPNLLSLFRLTMVPVTVILIFRTKMIAAFIAFAVAETTDLVDGYIARRCNQISKLGIFLDPLADKAMAIGVICSFTLCGILPSVVIIVLVVKELIMLLGGVLMLRKGYSAPSNKLGKICSFIMNIAIATGFFCDFSFFSKIYTYVIYVGLAFSVFAMVQYGVKNIKVVFGPPALQTEIESSK